MKASSFSVFVASAAFVTACGGASSPTQPQAPSAYPDGAAREPATVAEAQRQIDAARAELGDGSAPFAQPLHPPASPSSPPLPKSESNERPTPQPERPSDAKPGAQPHAERGGRCETTCHAIISMRHAVEALCRMTGDTDTRCRDAKKTLAESEVRVTVCTCYVND